MNDFNNPAAAAPARILVVDDEPLGRLATLRILRSAGYEAFEAGSGAEGLALTRELRPDLVLLDLMLPDINGLQVCRQIKAGGLLSASLVVFLTSSSPSSDEQADGLASGADGYVLRPVSRRELLERINALLRLRRAEQALSDSEERFRTVFEQAAVGILQIALDGRIMQANTSVCQLLGHTPEELRQLTFADITAQEDLAEEQRRLEEMHREGAGGYSLEKRYLHRDGHPIWVCVTSSLARDPAGRPRYRISVIEDITARHKAETSLRESDRRFRALFEAVPHLVWTADAAGRLTFFNQRAAEFFGTPAAGLEASDWNRHVHPEDLPGFLAAWERALAGRGEFRAECRFRRPQDGQYRWHSSHAMAVKDPQGGIQHWYGTSTDIQERRLAQAALQQANERLEREVHQRTEDLLLLSRTLQMINACQQAIIHSASETQLLESVCRLILEVGGFRMAWVGMAEHDRRKTVRPVASAGADVDYLHGIRVTWGRNRFGRGPTGTAIRTSQVCRCDDFLNDPKLLPWREQAAQRGYRSSVALPLIFENRTLGALTIYAVEPAAFSDRHTAVLKQLADSLAFGICSLRVQAERDQARKDLEQKAAQLRDLAAQLTRAEQRERRHLARQLHDDLQQLLMAARYGVESLSGRVRSAPAKEEIAAVVRLLDESIAATRSLVFDLVPPILFDLGLAPALEWLAKRMTARHGLEVKLDIDQTCAVEGEIVRVLLFESARELLLNVVKHSGVRSASLSLQPAPRHCVVLEVSDSGVGFDVTQILRRTGEEGGFGLFSVRERLDILGARLTVESRPGHGSRFRVTAPAAAAPPSPPPAP